MYRIKNIFQKVVTSAILLSPSLVFAQAPGTITGPGGTTITPKTTFTKENLSTNLGTVVSYILGIILIIAVAMIIYGGFLYITAGANEDNTKKAKTTLLYGVIGVIVAALSYAIVSFATSFLTP